MTHERDPGENLSFFARAKPPHSTLHFPSCGSLVLSLSPLLHCIFLFLTLLEEVLLSSVSRHSPSSFGSSLPFPPTSLPFSLSLLLSFFLIPLLSPPSFFSTSALLRLPPHRASLSIYFSLFGAVDRVTSNVNQSAGIVASFLRQWFSIATWQDASRRAVCGRFRAISVEW